ncbi:MAG TPA: glycoside hydrolase family 66 protein [Anaerolineales bacterium]|nr:glycoside hydrolase family 66 protein [Anaerolineales bacterium]
MRIFDFYPSQGSYSPGEIVTFFIELETSTPQDIQLRIFIKHLADRSVIIEQTLHCELGAQTVHMQWTPPAKPAGYSARLEILSANISQALHATAAFDVLNSWIDFPRYGFLTDFSASRADPETVLKKLTRFHINGLQFYDWQYRHDQLLAPTEEYVDPLGRVMSLASIRKLVDVAHRHGMAAMPYLAIYAASADFWSAHPDWALYDKDGNPIAFGENFLGLMDPSAGRPWSEHLLAECARALENIPFDGLHIDQYGDPKHAWDSQHNPVDLPRAFVDFIQLASGQHPNQIILFNAVGNWPTEVLAESAVDFMYIEVWPPDVEYHHLAEVVLNAVRLSHGKSVVIALYLPANYPANNLLADAVILACGGTRIELGEDARLLSDPYFPKHEEISSDLYSQLRSFSDFAVRNGEWLRPYALSTAVKEAWAGGELNPKFISNDDSIWAVARKYPKLLVVQLVNFSGLDPHQRWDKEHVAPTLCENVFVKIETPQPPSQILWDCLEQIDGPQVLNFEYSNGTLTFQIPQIHFIGLVAIHE